MKKDDEGKLELSLRVLGNEIIGFKMIVDDFKMKWMLLGLVAIVGLSWAMGTYGPMLMPVSYTHLTLPTICSV